MANMLNFGTILGILLLTHAAYSAAQASSTNIPVRIIIQALASMLFTMASVVKGAGFTNIEYTGHKNYDTIVNRPSLYTFNHRGKFIYARTARL